MADAIIDMVGPEDLPLICRLYNQIFRPPRDKRGIDLSAKSATPGDRRDVRPR